MISCWMLSVIECEWHTPSRVREISHLSRTCFYHLRQLRVVRRSLITDSAHSLIRALDRSRVDYCNGVMAGLPLTQVNRLQSTLRAAARLVLQLPGWAGAQTSGSKQAVFCCHLERPWPVSRIWCVCSSTGFRFHRGSSSSCARWCTGVFITWRRYTYSISACPSRLSRVVLTSDRLQPVTFAWLLQRLWQSTGVNFPLPVLRLGSIYPQLWKTLH